MTKYRTLFFNHSACLASAALLNLSYLEVSLPLFVWFALAPALYVARNSGLRGGYYFGFFTGSVASFMIFDWVANLAENFMFIPPPWNWAVQLLFSFNMAQCLALAFLLRSWLGKIFPRISLFIFPTACTSLAYLYPTIFPFSFADSQSAFPLALQMTEYLGGTALSWLILLVNELLARAGDYKNNRKPRWEVALAGIALSLWFGLGSLRMDYWKEAVGSWKEYPVGMVQPNQDILEKKGRTNAEKIKSYEFGASLELAKKDPLFIAWPEGITHGYFWDRDMKRRFNGFLAELKTPLIVQETMLEDNKSYNSAVLFDSGGRVADRYHKQKLILFGEDIPFESVTNFFLGFLGFQMHSFDTGTEQNSFRVDGVEIMARICYESLFPVLIGGGMAENGKKKMILFLTESEWYGSAKQIQQHLRITLVRAVENRSSLVHVINGGFSNVILPTGEFLFQAPYHETGAYLAGVPYEKNAPQTFFTRFPWLIISAFHVFTFGLIFLGFLHGFSGFPFKKMSGAKPKPPRKPPVKPPEKLEK